MQHLGFICFEVKCFSSENIFNENNFSKKKNDFPENIFWRLAHMENERQRKTAIDFHQLLAVVWLSSSGSPDI
jgi:hypothetical protein